MGLIGLAVVLTLSLTLAPLAGEAQQAAKVHQLGYLSSQSPVPANRVEALRMGLRDLGYVEGKNIAIAFRPAETAERLPEAAADLVRLKVDVIFATSSTEVEAARRATKTIPIVFATHADPVALGHVASLARPGGNIIGLAICLRISIPKCSSSCAPLSRRPRGSRCSGTLTPPLTSRLSRRWRRQGGRSGCSSSPSRRG